ncbi:hypothetical protein FQ707_12555 [Bacteroidaceae bacterium HV4-6-C5C]|nr:hypothetical protein FQ707_12555 [Bacteroidaceae bacterium HV4-6-C5C]
MKTNVFKTGSLFTVILLGYFLIMGLPLHAQESKSTSEKWARALTDQMKEKLSLDSQQYSKVYDINLKYIKKNMELQNSSARRMEKFKILKANMEAKDKELKNILTADQYKVYETMKEQLKEELKEKYKNRT